METLRVERERGREGEWHKIPGRSRMIKADVSRLICPFIGVANYESFEREDSSYLVSIAPDIDPNRAADSPISSGPNGRDRCCCPRQLGNSDIRDDRSKRTLKEFRARKLTS